MEDDPAGPRGARGGGVAGIVRKNVRGPICGNFAVYSPVNGRKSGVNEIEWQGIAYLSLYRYMAIYVVFYFD